MAKAYLPTVHMFDALANHSAASTAFHPVQMRVLKSMSFNPLRPVASDTAVSPPVDDVIWFHEAFCSMALPMRSTRGVWQRDCDGKSFRLEPQSSDDVVPSGRVLRLSMMHICDVAFRAQSQVVDIGENGMRLINAMGLDQKTRDLAEQWQRLQAARIMLSGDGEEVSVFDARSRRRANDLAWRSDVRLSGKFLSSLLNHGVPLSRRVVTELSAKPAALDAYAWISMSLHLAGEGAIVSAPWDDLLRRLGTASQDVAGFRSAFELALRVVYEADASLDLAVDDDGVSARRAEPADQKLADHASRPMLEDADLLETPGTKQHEQPTERPSPAPFAAETKAVEPAVRLQVVGQAGRGDEALSDTTVEDRIPQDNISLLRNLTGLTQVIWLRRGSGEESALVGVTPNPRFEPERLTVLAVEPMVLQISGGLNERDFERVSTWVMTNRDVIDEFWEGRITSFAELTRRVRKVPDQGLR